MAAASQRQKISSFRGGRFAIASEILHAIILCLVHASRQLLHGSAGGDGCHAHACPADPLYRTPPPGSGWPPGIAYGQSGIRPYPIRAAARAAYPPDSLGRPSQPACLLGYSSSLPCCRARYLSVAAPPLLSVSRHSLPVARPPARPPASQPSRVSGRDE